MSVTWVGGWHRFMWDSWTKPTSPPSPSKHCSAFSLYTLHFLEFCINGIIQYYCLVSFILQIVAYIKNLLPFYRQIVFHCISGSFIIAKQLYVITYPFTYWCKFGLQFWVTTKTGNMDVLNISCKSLPINIWFHFLAKYLAVK